MSSTAPGTRTLLYSDLNCPFCYVLYERLWARGLQAELEWRGVEHEPGLPAVPAPGPDDVAELRAEVEEVRRRVPSAELTMPRFRPNSRRAIDAVRALGTLDLSAARRLTLALYRALWRQGRDISSPRVIEALCGEIGIEVPPPAEAGVDWTAAWRGAGYRRIPVMVTPSGSTLLGLPGEREVEVFLASGLYSAANDAVCSSRDP